MLHNDVARDKIIVYKIKFLFEYKANVSGPASHGIGIIISSGVFLLAFFFLLLWLKIGTHYMMNA